ncbi:hypothetical protein AX17_005378 [Amanita inopinata Kibby_2008]|nr:hypothetical protein AX17_005378 [Amanita inopinata Kibby_2008]
MTSDSSASTTPMVLTPDSTGTGSPDSSTSSISRNKRRLTAFYPNTKSANKTLKPFSRSAAKRESVMALGSIEHLQHYFTKTGLAAKKDLLDKTHYGLVPAIGGASYVPTAVPIDAVPEFELPPSPELPLPRRPTIPSVEKTYETDPESLLPGVVDDLNAVALAWQIEADDHSNHKKPLLTVSAYEENDASQRASASLGVDILSLLKTTTRAIRSSRNYLVSLPDDSPGTTRTQFRPTLLGPSRPKSNATSAAASDPSTKVRKSALEVLAALREVEERYRLPLSDEAYDAQSDGGAGSTNGSGRHGSHSRIASPSNGSIDLPADDMDARHASHDGDLSITYSLVQVGGRYETVPVWEVEGDDFEGEGVPEKRELWDERLVLGSGWLYRQDVRMEELAKERSVVRSYLDMVDAIIFGGGKDKNAEDNEGVRWERGWERERRRVLNRNMRPRSKGRRVSAGDGEGQSMTAMMIEASKDDRRRVSAGMIEVLRGMSLSEEPEEMDNIPEGDEDEESVDDEDLPEWARRGKFVDGQAHALLVAFLPLNLLPVLGPRSSRSDFLNSLSSGQLLCVAYNACVRKSKKPWGYVNKDSIHDIIALEKAEKEGNADSSEVKKKGWTFRRTDNLRLWVGALKLRYLLPIQTPSQPLGQNSLKVVGPLHYTPNTSPTRIRFVSTQEPLIEFDAKVVARKENGWENMLEGVIFKWVQQVVDERRSLR